MIKIVGCRYLQNGDCIITCKNFKYPEHRLKIDLNQVLLRCESYNGIKVVVKIPEHIKLKCYKLEDRLKEVCKCLE